MKLSKYTKKINKQLTEFINVFVNLFVWIVIAELLFGSKSPFGVLDRITGILNNISDNGIAGLISLIIILIYFKK
tara:strand:+ start:365 stop:589 length:225 start_codon:yes stop_codon:yes gene_type:complete